MQTTTHRSYLTDKHLQSILRTTTTQNRTPNIKTLFAKKRCQTSSFDNLVWEFLQRLQNRAAKSLLISPYDYSTTCLLKELGWPSIKDIVFKETGMMTFKSTKHDLTPSYLNDLFRNLSHAHPRKLRNTKTDLCVPWRISCNGQKSFSLWGAKLWNELNNEQKSVPSFKAFKKSFGPC